MSAALSRKPLPDGRTVAERGAYAVIVSIISLGGTLAAGYFFINVITGSRISLIELLHVDYFQPIAAIATAIAIGVIGMLHFIESRTNRRTSSTAARTAGKKKSQDLTEAIARMTRNADRLNEVERDLINKLSAADGIDLQTDRLITEMRICTNRLLAQLQELDAHSDNHRSENGLVREAVYRAD